ncbi:MAG: TlpA disulfide reductase family protein [Candidatus Thiodiazotropha sp.]
MAIESHDGGCLVVVRRGLSLLLLACLTLIAGCGGSDSAGLVKGEATPGFELQRLDRGMARFPGDFAGQVVVIRFWADWCPFCESEMKAIEPVYRKYREKGLRILALNVRQDRRTATAFIDKLGISYDTLLDEEGAVARAYGVIGLPTTFILDRKGRLATRILGESSAELFEQLVRDQL